MGKKKEKIMLDILQEDEKVDYTKIREILNIPEATDNDINNLLHNIQKKYKQSISKNYINDLDLNRFQIGKVTFLAIPREDHTCKECDALPYCRSVRCSESMRAQYKNTNYANVIFIKKPEVCL